MRRVHLIIGLFVIAPVPLAIAFFLEPEHGLAGRSHWSLLPLLALFAGSIAHVVSFVGASTEKLPKSAA